MTQHITTLRLGTQHYLADRLLTVDGSEYDARSNKTALVALDQSSGTIAYAGDSLVGGMPTDEWLVRAMLGGSLRRKSAVPLGLDAHHVGEVADRLQRAIDRLGSAGRGQSGLRAPLLVSYVGYQRTRRGRVRPFAFEFAIQPGDTSCSRRFVRDANSAWRREGFAIATPPLPEAEAALFSTDCRDQAAAGELPFLAGVEAMRRAARRTGVGDRVMDLRITPRANPSVEVRLHRPSAGADVVDVGRAEVEVCILPWIVTTRVVQRPQAIGPTDLLIGGAPFWIRVFPPEGSGDDDVLASFVSLPTTSRRRPTKAAHSARYGSDVVDRAATGDLIAQKLDEILSARGLGPSTSKWVGFQPPGVVAVVDRLPTGQPLVALDESLAALGVPVALVTPTFESRVVGEWPDAAFVERLTAGIIREWRHLRHVESLLAARARA